VGDNPLASEPWTGFYAYAPQDRQRMDLNLTFANAHVPYRVQKL
jgi:hypothetical protein